MAGSREIRTKIKSVQNTRKITKAMEMVAASKMRKAQERMRAARPYAERVRSLAANLSHATPEYKHPFMIANAEAKVAGFIVVTTDKGLCGGLNTNVLRATTVKLKELESQGVRAEAVAIGNKGLGFLNRIGAKVVSHATHLGDRPLLEKLIGPVKVLLDAYAAGQLNAVYLCYTRFINTMRQEPVIQQLLPLSDEQMSKDEGKHGWDYIYEPDAKVVIDELLVRYIEALVYQATAENMASEQSARMVAMKSATDNAGSVIGELKLVYNKTRQAAITKELSEIVAGAAAVLFAVNVTAVIPATPANIGVFQAACVAVLAGAYHVSTPDALAYGIVLQVVEIATAVLMGVPALITEGLSWKDVRLRTMAGAPVKLSPLPAGQRSGSAAQRVPSGVEG